MLPIAKLPDPEGLIRYKRQMSETGEKQTYVDFTNFEKGRNEHGERIPSDQTAFYQLRAQLLKEQKYLCAYCGQEIPTVENDNNVPQMKTEHFSPQNDNPDNDLNYQNLLACCLGNDRQKGENHCDSMKANGLLIHIANPATIQHRDIEIVYNIRIRQEEVVVDSTNQDKSSELTGKKEGCLNLNHDFLRKGRFSVWKNVMRKRLGDDPNLWNADAVKEIINEYSSAETERSPKFKDFILWYLKDWLSNRVSL